MGIEILDSTACELGEGPTFDPLQNKAWWFDIVGKNLFEHDFRKGVTTVHPLPFMASMLGVIDENTQLVAAQDGLYLRDTHTNRFTLRAPLEANNKTTRSNDGRVHPSGALWIGTMGKNAEKQAGAIYWYYRGKLRKLFANITIPNAICFAPDGATAYFIDSRTGLLMQVAIDRTSGLPLNEPHIFFDHRANEGVMDGAIVDARGVIWTACWGASRLQAISPQGVLVRSVRLPVRQPTCPAFLAPDLGAAPNLGKILVTSAWQGMDDAARGGDIHAGKTLVLDIEVKGCAEPRIVL